MEILEMDNEMLFTVDSISEGHHKVKYRGIKLIKDPFDYLLYQMLINEVKPDLIIEIGTYQGSSALYMADILDLIGDDGVVHTIDVNEYPMDSLVLNHPRIIRFLGGFENYDLENTKGFNNILVIDDGSHIYTDVKLAMDKFKDIVSINSYLIVEDGMLIHVGLEEQYDGGPLRAIGEFLPDNTNFQIDRKWCDFFGKNATFNPNGFLKKIS
jgi:cephalosporin hydroxylase